jgi:hypothetical protein
MTVFSDRYGAWLKLRGYQITDETDRMVELLRDDGTKVMLEKRDIVLTWLDDNDAL